MARERRLLALHLGLELLQLALDFVAPGERLVLFLPLPSNLDRKQFMSKLETTIENTTRDLEKEALRHHPHLHLNPVNK